MAELKVNEITTSTVNADDKVYAFSNLTSKAPAVKDLVCAAPSVMANGTCNTLADVATKEVTSSDWNAKECQSIIVAFAVANTAENVSLSINGGTALPVYAINSSNLRLGPGSIPIGFMIFTLSSDGLKFYAHTNIVSKDNTKTTFADGTEGYTKAQADAIKTNLQDQITVNAGNITTIQGNDTAKSMRTVAEEVVNALPAVYTPKGTVAFANLPALANCNIGWVYNISDSFTTTSDFIEGSGIVKEAGTNIAIIDSDGNGTKKYDVLSGAVDLSGYQTKNLSQAVGSFTTVEAALQGIYNSQTTLVAGNLAGEVPVNGSDLGTTNNNVIVTDANGGIKPSGIVIGTAAGKTAGNASGNVPVNGAALGTTNNNVIVTDANGDLKPYGTVSQIRKVANGGYICTTAANEQDKVVTIPDFELYEGVTIKVLFINKNTENSPNIKIVDSNNTVIATKEIKAILSGSKKSLSQKTISYYKHGLNGSWTATTDQKVWDAYTTLELIYDGTDFVIMGNPILLAGEDFVITPPASATDNPITTGSFNVYANGYIEQWGISRPASATVQYNTDIVLPIVMSDNRYSISGINAINAYGGLSILNVKYDTLTTTGFRLGNASASTTYTVVSQITWNVKGY